MTTFTMSGADHFVALHHLAFYGLADVLDEAGVRDVTLSWDGPVPGVLGEDLTADLVDETVRAHVECRRPWVERTIGSDRRGTMSPRLSQLQSGADWNGLRAERHDVLDLLTRQQSWADLRYLAALGEPAYWRFARNGNALQDDGASRWEMQPRNRGSEFVGNRLRPLTEKLLARKPGMIAAGLAGTVLTDEIGGKADSVSATGLTTPGPVDNALVWCALWAIGQFPSALRLDRAAPASGHLGRGRSEWFYVPVWEGTWRPARLRSILASGQLRRAAGAGLEEYGRSDSAIRSATAWLRARGIVGVFRFPIGRFGSDNAPERRALRADAVPLSGAR